MKKISEIPSEDWFHFPYLPLLEMRKCRPTKKLPGFLDRDLSSRGTEMSLKMLSEICLHHLVPPFVTQVIVLPPCRIACPLVTSILAFLLLSDEASQEYTQPSIHSRAMAYPRSKRNHSSIAIVNTV